MKKPSNPAIGLERPSWRPILTGEIKERALATVGEIVAALPNPLSAEISDASLSGGSAGLAVLCAYLSRAGLDDDENAAQFLAHAVNSVSAQQMGPSLYGGFTGIAWTAAHLQEQLLDPEDDPNEAIDEALKAYLVQSPWQDDYDLIIGLVGIGVYAIERLPRASAVECLERVVDRLDEIAEHSVNGVTWLTRPDLLPEWQRALCPDGYYNLGLAHGVPGVIALLGQICAAGVALQKARPLLDDAVAWLSRQRSIGATQSSFSSWTGPGREREALALARRAAERKPESAGVKDAGLCHGSAGLGHIFNRLFQTTGEESFSKAARYWIERTLEMRRPGQGIAGFSAYRAGNDGQEEHWEDRVGILEGAAGIALVLLAATTEIEPAWDRMLLVSFRGGEN